MTSARPVLDETAKERLVADARRALERSYSPYSPVRVGAALLSASGRTHLGASIGNASSALNACAESVAVSSAVMAGDATPRRNAPLAIAVVRSAGGACVPCGRCLQVLSEFADDLVVLTEDGDGRRVEWTLRALQPVPYRRPDQGTK